MILNLQGLQDASRIIEVKVNEIKANLRKGIEKEIELVRSRIEDRMRSGGDASLVPYLRIDFENMILHLQYDMGSKTLKSGQTVKNVSARKKHNPHWKAFKHQPVQDALKDLGYSDISPDRGVPISPASSGSAPNVRISATVTPEVIRRIMK
jgi:hypothetical protein